MVKTIFYKFCGGYGDALLNSPAVEGLAEKFPQARIYAIDDEKYVHLFEHNPHIAGFVSSYEQVFKGKESNFHKLLHDFSRQEVIVYPCYGSKRPTLVKPMRHAVDLICHLIKVNPKSRQIRIYLSAEDEAFAKTFFKQYPQRVVLFHNKHFAYAPQKEWFNDRWPEVIDYIKQCGYQVIQVGENDDHYIEGTLNLLGETTIRQAIALLKYADCFLGLDSVFNHASNAFLKPSVVLFGSTTPKVWGYEHNINLYKGLKCQPCYDLLQDRCHLRRCMDQITVTDVITALSRIIHK